MGKRFIKFRVSRVIPSFQSCRSKDPSSLPSNPVPSFLRLTSPSATATTSLHYQLTHQSPPPQPPRNNNNNNNPKPHHHSLKHHVSSAFLSARRTIMGSSSSRSYPDDSRTQSTPSTSRFRWRKDPKWHVIAKIPNENSHNYHSTPPRRKIYNSAASDTENENENENDVVVFPPLPLKKNRKPPRRVTGRPRRSFQKVRLSTSSDSGLFSEDDDNDEERENLETDTLVSTDYDDSCSTPRHHRRSNARKRRWKGRRSAEEGAAAPARVSVFMRKMVTCRAVEGKVRESFAVVKRSEEPYEDFKRSMAEMVVEKQMFEAAELEELLRCFLSLNSVHHHEVIVRAFTEIWEALFCQSSS